MILPIPVKQVEGQWIPAGSDIPEGYIVGFMSEEEPIVKLMGEPIEDIPAGTMDVDVDFQPLETGTWEEEYEGLTVQGTSVIPSEYPVREYRNRPGGDILGKLIQIIPAGTSGEEVTAIPSEGFSFVKWSDGVSTESRIDFSGGMVYPVYASVASDKYIFEQYREY